MMDLLYVTCFFLCLTNLILITWVGRLSKRLSKLEANNQPT